MDIWVTAKECAGLPGMPTTERGCLKSLSDNASAFSRQRPKTKSREYPIHVLPAHAQVTLILQQRPEANASEGLWDVYDALPDTQKSRARQRLDAVLAVEHLLQVGEKKSTALRTVSAHIGVQDRTLYRWYQLINGKPRTDWVALLAPAHNAAGRKKIELHPDAWTAIRSDWLRAERPTVKDCYRRATLQAEERGWGTLPSVDTVERRLRQIPTAVRVLLRDGEHALARLYPHQTRSVKDLHALQWINGDGYQHNLFVRWPDGSLHRPKTWFWQDVYSRKILAYRVDISENSDVIRGSFGDLVEQYGIPYQMTIDNTRGAANKWLTGGTPNRYRFKVKDDDPLGVFTQLNISVHWSSIIAGQGWGQAKPVERAFGKGGLGDWIDKDPQFTGAYTGPDPQSKPHNYASSAVELETFLEVLNQRLIQWNARSGRRTELGRGQLSYDQIFERSYAQAPIRKATAAQRRLWLLTAEATKVQSDGSITLAAGAKVGEGRNRYYNGQLLDYAGKKVVIRFDPERLHDTVHAYSIHGAYICPLDIIENTGFGDQAAGRVHAAARRSFIKATKQAAAALKQLEEATATIHTHKQRDSKLPPAATSSRVSRLVTPPVEPPILSQPSAQPDLVAQATQTLAELQPTQQARSQIPSDIGERYEYWQRLDAQLQRGESLPQPLKDWHTSYRTTSDWEGGRSITELRSKTA